MSVSKNGISQMWDTVIINLDYVIDLCYNIVTKRTKKEV